MHNHYNENCNGANDVAIEESSKDIERSLGLTRPTMKGCSAPQLVLDMAMFLILSSVRNCNDTIGD